MWVYLLVATAGVVAIVPTILRAIDGKPHNLVTGAIGFTGVVAGLIGLFCVQLDIDLWETRVAAAAVGAAAGVLHPELLSLISTPHARAEHDAV